MLPNVDRPALLDSYARAYARERFALIFTQGLDKRFGKGWPDAKPVTSEDFAAALVVGRCLSEKSPRNVGVSLAASNLVGVEVDTAEGLELIDSLTLPPTWTVRSGGGGPGRHFYFRPPADDVSLFAFRIEAQGVTAERTRGLVLPRRVFEPRGRPVAEKKFQIKSTGGKGGRLAALTNVALRHEGLFEVPHARGG